MSHESPTGLKGEVTLENQSNLEEEQGEGGGEERGNARSHKIDSSITRLTNLAQSSAWRNMIHDPSPIW